MRTTEHEALKTADPPMLLDVRMVLRHVPVSRSVLDRWVSEGYFPKADIVRGTKIRLWRRTTIEAWARQHSAEPSAK